MSREDLFNGAKNGFLSSVAYFNTVAQEIGIKQAVALNTKMNDELGVTLGKMLKEQSGINDFDLPKALSLLKPLVESNGIKLEVVEENPQKVVIRSGRCPVYEAGQMMGLSAETIESFCRSGGERCLEIVAKQLNPNLSFQLMEFRESADDFCESKIELV